MTPLIERVFVDDPADPELWAAIGAALKSEAEAEDALVAASLLFRRAHQRVPMTTIVREIWKNGIADYILAHPEAAKAASAEAENIINAPTTEDPQ